MSVTSAASGLTCVLCGGTDAVPIAARGDFSVVRCVSCGLAFGTPQPDEARLEAQYRQDETSPTEYYTRTEATDLGTFRKRVAVIERFHRPGTLLDVGCNVGTFLIAARERAWRTQGLEANPCASAIARGRGLDVEEGFFEPAVLSRMSERPDAIHMGDVIEHFRNPLAAVTLAKERLKDAGVLCIVTPDFDCWIVRRFQIKPLEHLFYFTSASLTRLLEAAGFRVRYVEKTTRRRDIDSLLYGTTFHGPIMPRLLKMVSAFGLGAAMGTGLEWLIRDELFVIAEKPRAPQ